MILGSWTALQLAVQNEWGGPYSGEKFDWLKEQVIALFSTKGTKIEIDDLLDLLEGVLEEEFNTIAEDESCEEIAKMLLRLFHECINAKTAYLDEVRALYEQSQRENYAKASVGIANDDEEEVELECSSDEENEE